MKRATFQELPSVEGHSELAVIAWEGGSGSISHLKHVLPPPFFFSSFLLVPFFGQTQTEARGQRAQGCSPLLVSSWCPEKRKKGAQ